MSADASECDPARRRSRLTLLLVLFLSGGISCSRLARCEMDKVRAEVLDYAKQRRTLHKQERRLKHHIAEFDGKIFTNQKAGVDLLRAVLVKELRAYLAAMRKIKVRSRLLQPHHAKLVAALADLLEAYESLMRAYPREDFDAIRTGLARRRKATRALQRAEQKIRRLVQKYRKRRG